MKKKNQIAFSMAATTLALGLASPTLAGGDPEHSVARLWNDANLEAIRNDFARPTIHARNLFHVAIAMWDAWAIFDDTADPYLTLEQIPSKDVQAAQEEAISYAAYRMLVHRYTGSPGEDETLPALDALMASLGYDINNDSIVGSSPAAVGNRCAANVIAYGLVDGANESGEYENLFYEPINEPLVVALPGNPDLTHPNRWQPLALEFFIDQSGNIIIGGFPDFLSPEWGIVEPFAMTPDQATIYQRDGFDYWVYHDPGDPPFFNGAGDPEYRWGYELVAIWSGHLDPADGVMIDASPASIGNIPSMPDEFVDFDQFYDLFDGGDNSLGWDTNPATGQPYEPQMVPRGDYGRILAEFWADGPDSETPPGHWFSILNYVNDHPDFEKRMGGEGPVLDGLEWDVKAYLAMGGAMHDAAIAAWGVKGWYDYIRPVSAIRYMADQGQSSDPDGPSYSPDGIRLYPGHIEVVTAETTQPGERHAHLAGDEGKIALLAWRGPDYIIDPETDTAGVGWILAENWWPYQRPSFVSPPFAGYVSGHSTYSRAAAELMTLMTGDEFFPGGMGIFDAPQNEYLVFEEGPSIDIELQWATYTDASDQCSLSRIWGGIHPPADDIPGRKMGQVIGPEAYRLARKYFNGQLSCPADTDGSGMVDVSDLLAVLAAWGECDGACTVDLNNDGVVDVNDLLQVLSDWGGCS